VFSIWTAALSALFNSIHGLTPFGCNWVMFVCLAVFFGMGLTPKDVPSALLSAWVGMAWGQFDFLLTDWIGRLGANEVLALFLAVLIGTAITMFIHIDLLKNTPLRHMPFVFAGVCLTFSQGGGNVIGLGGTFVMGLVLAGLCTAGMMFADKKWPVVTCDVCDDCDVCEQSDVCDK
jgi:hypothetical protein